MGDEIWCFCRREIYRGAELEVYLKGPRRQESPSIAAENSIDDDTDERKETDTLRFLLAPNGD